MHRFISCWRWVVCCFIPGMLHAQDPTANIIEKHIAALGGPARLDSLQSVVMDGTIRLQKFEIPLRRSIANNRGQRLDFTVGGLACYIIVTATEGWNYMPFYGISKPTAMKPEEFEMYTYYNDLQGPLYKYQEKGNSISYEGTETLEEINYYKIRVTMRSGSQVLLYIDSNTYFTRKAVFTIQSNGKEIKTEHLYANYQPNDQGFIFPGVMSVGPGRAFVASILVNTPLDPAIFTVNGN